MTNQIKPWYDVKIGEIFESQGYVYQKSTSRTAYCFKERRKFTFTKDCRCLVLGNMCGILLEAFNGVQPSQ